MRVKKNILHDDCMCIHGNMNGCAVNNEFKAPFLCCLSDAVTEVKKSWINADCYVLRAIFFVVVKNLLNQFGRPIIFQF
jgi:hypothetical protein